MLVIPAASVGAEKERAFEERVNEAIDRGLAWLIARPKLARVEGVEIAHWGLISAKEAYGGGTEQYNYPVGSTALALYTLLKCGVDPEHPVIRKGFAWLRVDHEFTEAFDGMPQSRGWRTSYREAWTSYELSMQILALTALYDPQKKTKATEAARRKGKLKIKDKRDRKWLKDLVRFLVERRGATTKSRRAEDRRGWRYNMLFIQRRNGAKEDQVSRKTGHYIEPADQDLSSTQLATLALFSAHQFGVKIPRDVWADIAIFSLSCQESEGPVHERHHPGYKAGDYAPPKDHARGFCYITDSPHRDEARASGAMTACGIANVLMAKSVLSESAGGRTLLGKQKHRLNSRIETAVWDGLAWLDLHWSAWDNPQDRGSYGLYYLYGLERALDLLGKELVGSHLWYREGAEQILAHQKEVALRKKAKEGQETGVYWETKTTHRPYDVLDTCFALLFLRRATRGLVPGGVPVTGTK